MSNRNFGLDINMHWNNPKHSSIKLLLSKTLVIKSGSVPSANESLFNKCEIILRHFSLFFWLF